jgi:frataxin-like iron-binding protein CyaY
MPQNRGNTNMARRNYRATQDLDAAIENKFSIGRQEAQIVISKQEMNNEIWIS